MDNWVIIVLVKEAHPYAISAEHARLSRDTAYSDNGYGNADSRRDNRGTAHSKMCYCYLVENALMKYLL